MTRGLKREPLVFLDAMKAEPDRLGQLPPGRAKRYAYVERGFYTRQLQRLWRHFSPAQLLIFKSEQLEYQATEVLAGIATFLGIAPFPPVASKKTNARKYGAMTDEERWYLIAMFEPEIRELEHMLGWDCSAWLA
jgi:hypothetical protein